MKYLSFLKDLAVWLYLVFSLIFLSVHGLGQAYFYGAWLFLGLPLLGFIAMFRLWDIYKFVGAVVEHALIISTDDAGKIKNSKSFKEHFSEDNEDGQ